MHRWLSAPDLAKLAGIASPNAQKALRRAFTDNLPWNGALLEVRVIQGVRGGRSGRIYVVNPETLPEPLKERWKADKSTPELPLIHGEDAAALRSWWLFTIEPALKHRKGTLERAAAVREIAGREHFRDGERVTLSARTIQRKLDAYECDGLAGLGRRKRMDAGESRVTVSGRWDRAVPLGDAAKHTIADKLNAYVGGLVKGGETAAVIELQAARELAELTVKAGFDPGAAELARICKVPGNLIQRHAQLRNVYTFRTDAKRFHDQRPGILRQAASREPMGLVFGDVHHMDLLVRREDGSIATPKAVAWLDVATGRIWMDVVLLGPGEGIRNTHVMASLVRMMLAWGVPRRLYLDNGKEYKCADFLDDVLKLRSYGLEDAGERQSSIVRAQPYNARAKPIEGVFANLERNHFRLIPGWIGGNRMKSKTANVGRAPEPFPGSFDDFRTAVALAVATYHTLPQKRGQLKGRSPLRAYEEAIAAGWTMTTIDPDALRLAWSEEKPKRVVHQGRIRHDGEVWTCPELQSYLGEYVSLRVPKWGDWTRLPVCDDRGELLGFAERDRPFDHLDPAGARESRTRANRRLQAVKALDRSVPDVNALAERVKLVAAEPQAAAGAAIGVSDAAKRMLAKADESPADKAARKAEEASRRQRERLALYEKFEELRRC